jgi:asparagine N-glycosylation enzyme membrane subunit Stt3
MKDLLLSRLSFTLRKSLVIFAVFYLGFFIAYYYITPFSSLYALRILLGVIALIFIPGFLFSLILKSVFSLIEELGFSLIFGLMLQALNVVIMWALLDNLIIGFMESICILTLVEVFIMVVFIKRKGLWSFQGYSKNVFDILLLVVFSVSILLSFWYQSFNINYITPDGAYYCDIARNIVTEGLFKPKSLIPTSFDPVLGPIEQLGFFGHPLVSFTLSLFFAIGGVSYFSAKLMTLFLGSLLVFPVYSLCKELFNEKVGIIAALIVALLPLRVFYSSILFGNEMVSNLYFLLAFFFFTLGFKHNKHWEYLVLSGAFLFLTNLAWLQAQFFFPVVPFLLAFATAKITRKLFFWGIVLSGLAFFFTMFGMFFINYLYWIFLILLELSICIIGLRNKEPSIRQISLFYLAYTILTLFWSIRAFSHPEVFSIIGSRYSESVATFAPSAQVMSLSARINSYFSGINEYVGSPLIILSIISILVFQSTRTLKRKILLFIYPLFYSIVLITYLPMGFEDRLFTPLIPFLSMLSASLIESLFSIGKSKPTANELKRAS